MKELITITYEKESPIVSGRELHEKLEIETPYMKWFERMCEYGFEENSDFWTNLSESTGGRPATNHMLTLDMAKQRAMDMGLFQVKESTISNPDGSIRVTRTTKVLGKGQTYFVNVFLSGHTIR